MILFERQPLTILKKKKIFSEFKKNALKMKTVNALTFLVFRMNL